MSNLFNELKVVLRAGVLALMGSALIFCSACGEEETVAEAVDRAVSERAERLGESEDASAADLLLLLVALADFSESELVMDDGPCEGAVFFSSPPVHASASPSELDHLAMSSSFKSTPSPDPAPETDPGSKSIDSQGLTSAFGGRTTEAVRASTALVSISPDPAPEGPDAG